MFSKLDYGLFLSLSLHLSSLLSGLHLLGVLGGVVGLFLVLLGNFEKPTPPPPKPTTPTTPIEESNGNGELSCVVYNESKTLFKTTSQKD